MVHSDNFLSKPVPLSEDVVCDRIQTSLTDGDLKRYLGDVDSKIIKYSELADFASVNELLPRDRDFKVLLIEDSPNKGHWAVLLRYGKTIEYFDSYGKKPDYHKAMFGKLRNLALGQHEDYLTDLIKRSKGFKVVYNTTHFQKVKQGINTCGRWILLRIITMRDMQMDLLEFQKMVKATHQATGLPLDALVSIWIN